MTKEVDFLSLTKTSTNKVNNTNNSNATSTKKEGLSLFDSLLVNNKAEDTDTNLTKDTDLKKTSLNNQNKENSNIEKVTKTTSETKTLDNKVDTTKEKNINDKTLTLNESEKSDVKLTQSSSSFLDKMIIESKKINKATEVNTSIKNINNVDTEKQDTSVENSKTTTSLFDELTKENESLKTKNTIDTSLNKENEIKNLTLDEVKSDETLEKVKDENISKNVIPKVDIEKNDTNINKVSLNETDNKTEKKDIKEIKINTIKEQVQSTLTFDNNSNDSTDLEVKDTLKTEVKNEIKNIDISKNILDNNSNNIEEKIETKNNSNIEVKTEVKNIEVSKNLEASKNVDEKLNSNNLTKNNNEAVSKEFTKLDSSMLNEDEQKISVDKNALLNNNTNENSESKNTKSLMDRLLDNATKTVNLSTNQNQNNLNVEQQSTISKTNEFVTNIFLGSQKNSIYNQMITNKSEGVKVVKDGSNIQDIKKGAEILNLGLEDASVETEVQKKSSITEVNKSIDNKESILNRLAFNKNTNTENVGNEEVDKLETKILNAQNLSSSQAAASPIPSATSSLSSSFVIEEAVSLTVNPSLALSIQNKIIGAQQHMSSMMSDIARNMYENYKPPVTAFRINLFPAQLGQIAILMKNDKENAISISLNMSNSNTLDAFVENQSVLRDALNRNFNNNQTTFNLDFSMDSESSGKESFNKQEQENNKNNETVSSNEIIEAINQNQNIGEDLEYL